MPPALEPGRYVCVQTRGTYAGLIRAFTSSPWTHASVYLGDGLIAQADGSGIHVDKLTRYHGAPAVANMGEAMTDAQRAEVCGAARAFTGDEYAWGDIGVIALRRFGFRWGWLNRVADARGTLICSELVAKAGLAAGLDWLCGESDPAYVVPGELARRPGVVPVSI